MSQEIEAIVCDLGSGLIKAGLSGEDTPRTIFPNMIGALKDTKVPLMSSSTRTPSPTSSLSSSKPKDNYIGTNCQLYNENLNIKYPIVRGKVMDWDAMESIWEYTFNHELSLNPELANLPILCIDDSMEEKKSREKMAEILFEVFKVPGFYVMQQSILSLFASGRTRGLIVESGYGTTNIVPIFEGYALPHATLHKNLSGYDLTIQLKKQLAKNGHLFKENEMGIVQNIKETFCYVQDKSSNKKQHKDENIQKPYELPDGNIIEINDQTCWIVSENFFQSSNTNSNDPSLHELIHSSISMCDNELQNDLYSSIVLAGGTTMLSGLAKRLDHELSTLNPKQNINIIPSYKTRERGYNSQRKIASWVGGSMFASLPTFSQVIVTKQEWDEGNETIIHRKCF